MTEYRSRLVILHSHTSGDVTMYFDATLNEEANKGWKLSYGMKLSKTRYLLIFERIEA